MREILFRGKRLNNGEWVYGSYVYQYGAHEIYLPSTDGNGFDNYNINPETVGQYTGLVDRNGNKIFEGDIFLLDCDLLAIVIFKCGSYCLEVRGFCGCFTESGYDECGGGFGVIECEPIDWYCIRDMETLGNIHDNPELLKR